MKPCSALAIRALGGVFALSNEAIVKHSVEQSSAFASCVLWSVSASSDAPWMYVFVCIGLGKSKQANERKLSLYPPVHVLGVKKHSYRMIVT
jgi:hypothetical protein